MKRGGQMTLSLGGSMRLVPASRSLLAVPAATGQPDAGRWSRLPSAPRKFSIVPSRRARARGCAIVLFAVCARFIGAEGVIKLCDMLLKFDILDGTTLGVQMTPISQLEHVNAHVPRGRQDARSDCNRANLLRDAAPV